jgi:hypothetical protein
MSKNVIVEGQKPDGTYVALNTDSSGNLVVSGSVGGGSSAVDNQAGSDPLTQTDVGGKKSLDVNVTDITLNKANDSVEAFTPNEKTLIDEASSTITYVGKAAIGSATSAASWKIKKIETTGTITAITFAGGSGNYTNIWDNRASLSYS